MTPSELAEQLHKWYLEGTKNHPDSFNPEAQKSYWELTDEQRIVDIFIADKILKNFISIKEHEKIVNKRQKIFLETSNKLANQMLNLKAKARKELKKKLKMVFSYYDSNFDKIIDEVLKGKL